MKRVGNIFCAIFAAGIVSLILELSLLREFVYIFGSTAFSNSLIISIFLAGLAVGAYLGTWKKLKSKNEIGARFKFALIQFFIIAFIVLFYVTRRYFVYICPSLKLVVLYFVVSVLTPSLFAGLSYAISVEILYHRGERSVTHIYAYSTFGSVVGGITHGIFLVPLLGMKSTYIFAIIFGTIALFFMYPFAKRVVKIALLLFILAMLFVIYSDCFTFFYSFKNLLFSKDSQFGVVEVWRGGKSNTVDLKINRIYQAGSSARDIKIHIQWAETTLKIVNHPCNVLLLGYGSGVTSAAFLKSPLVRRVDTVENCLPVIEASKKFFPEEYKIVINDKRSNIVVEDFRNFVRFTKLKYDIIVLDHSIVDPYYSGFFTLEFFDQLKRILNPNGIIALLGKGISWNTTRLSFDYIYTNINPEIDSFIRNTSLFLAMEEMNKNAANNYKLVEEGLLLGEPIYSDSQVYGIGPKEMIGKMIGKMKYLIRRIFH